MDLVILVTGVTGFLGGVIAKHLIDEENIAPKNIRFLARNKEKCKEFLNLGLELHYGDLAIPDSLEGIMKDVTTIYHNAAVVINESVSYDVMMKINYRGTVKLVEEFLKSESTSKFNFASTFGVYGFKFPKYFVNEDFPLSPANAYQESKVEAEQFLIKKNTELGLNATIYRYPLILGPRDTLTSLRLCQGLKARKIVYIGKAMNEFSMIDARDGARAMVTGTNNPKSKGQIYNIKSFDISQQNYFDYFADALGVSRPKKRYPKWLLMTIAWFSEIATPRGKEVLITRTRVDRYSEVRLSDDSKIRKELGFKPKYTNPKKVIAESVKWLINNNYLN